MSDDLVKRLRAGVNLYYGTGPCGLLNEAADRIDALEKALLEIFEVYAGSEGIPQPMNAAEGYLLKLVKEMANTARAALEGEDD